MSNPQQNTNDNVSDDRNPATPEFRDANNTTMSFQIIRRNNHRVSVKPAPFIKSAPKLYFMQMEAQQIRQNSIIFWDHWIHNSFNRS